VTISDNGNPASAVAKIDGAWSVADTTAVTVDGWATGPDNYIKIYTAPDARHNGRWDSGRFVHSAINGFVVNEDYVHVDGLQVEVIGQSFASIGIGVYSSSAVNNSDIRISNCRLRGVSPNTGQMIGINFGTVTATVWNTIIENLTVFGKGIRTEKSPTLYIYNSVIYNASDSGIVEYSNPTIYVKNTAIFNTNNDFNGTFNIIDHCASDDGDGTNAVIPSNWNDVFVDYANGDFHLKSTDTDLKNSGTDLSTYFSTDVDGASRNSSINNWDIGADETATQIFRSVGPSATGLLDSDNSHADLLNSITGGVATFEVALADNIGVGDVVIIDTGGTDQTIDASDTLLFIHSRTSSTSYTLRTHTGSIPTDMAVANDTWQIYRAHISMGQADNGTVNSTLSGLGFSFNGGGRDLLANNEEWNIACYANGTTADTTGATIDGWNTGAYNFLRFYTPVNASEVGVSQRHAGKWDENKFRIETVDIWNTIYIYSQFV
jgi:hypothetical protein